MATPDSQSTNYNDFLNKAAHEAQAGYDKAVLALSGGALGVSIRHR
jgi:hypothetical protein